MHQIPQELQISIVAEIPEDLHATAQHYLESHPDWDCDRLVRAGLSLFLLQNGTPDSNDGHQQYRNAARTYLNSLFGEAA